MGTNFEEVYDTFFSSITDDMFLELTEEDTRAICKSMLIHAVQKFEFPRVSLSFDKDKAVFDNKLSEEEINVIAAYMVVEWIGEQLAAIDLVRQKYSGADFKLTSQASHLKTLIQLKKEYEREAFHLQRLYKRRKKGKDGVYHSTFGEIMEPPAEGGKRDY